MRRLLLSIIIILIANPLAVIAQETSSRPKVGVVLSGGVARGFAHIGVLKVLEEAGIPIDYIGGTSMGSIIGGLYAIGYSADSIKSIALSQNWAEIFTDRTPRKYLSLEEKEKELKYYVPYPMSNGKLKLPVGAISGQNLDVLLSRLSWNVAETDRFAFYPIPFLCVATDLENGEAVVMREGNLAHSMRASMSMPGIFTPENIDGKLLVDGGLANNFPVEEVKEMGADIIIGVDVGFNPYTKNELNSAANIIEQSFFIYSVDENALKQKKCDILIKPELKKYALTEFDNAKEIINAGEEAARKQFERLKMLAEFIKESESGQEEEPLPVTDKIKIISVNVSGNKKIPSNVILSKFDIMPPASVSCQELEDGIQRIYGTHLFLKTEYSVHSQKDGDSISIEVTERPQELFSFGANYNSDLNASILMNAVFYNKVINGTKFFADAVIGQSPSLNLSLFKQLGWMSERIRRNQWLVGLNTSVTSLFLGNYVNNKKINNYRLNNLFLNLYSEVLINNSFAVGAGIQNEFVNISDDSDIFDRLIDNSFFNLAAHIKFDTYNNIIFPEKGSKFYGQIKYLTDFYDNNLQKGMLADFKLGAAIPVLEKLTVIPSACTGLTFIDSIPATIQYRIGGFNTYYTKNSYPLLGYNFMEFVTTNNAIARLDIQYQFIKRHYLILSANAGKASFKFDQLFSKGSSLTGYAITYGYNSIIGPLQVSIMNSKAHKILAYINVGLWF